MSTVIELVFNYENLKSDGENFHAEIPQNLCQEYLGELIGSSGYWVDETFKTQGTLYKSLSGEVIADCKISGQARFHCVSCGQSQILSWSMREDLIIVPEKHAAAQEEDLAGEGDLDIPPDIYTFSGHDLDLTPIICEGIVLHAPLHPRCETVSQTCQTLTQEELPQELTIDPRWAPLLKLQAKTQNKTNKK
jgi:uncharacterized metal-binding protein YceD (DUF177 family)